MIKTNTNLLNWQLFFFSLATQYLLCLCYLVRHFNEKFCFQSHTCNGISNTNDFVFSIEISISWVIVVYNQTIKIRYAISYGFRSGWSLAVLKNNLKFMPNIRRITRDSRKMHESKNMKALSFLGIWIHAQLWNFLKNYIFLVFVIFFTHVFFIVFHHVWKLRAHRVKLTIKKSVQKREKKETFWKEWPWTNDEKHVRCTRKRESFFSGFCCCFVLHKSSKFT